MLKPPKLGTLIIGEPAAPAGPPERQQDRAPREVNPWVKLSIALCAISGLAALWFSGWLPAQFVPRKVLIRGCSLTAATDVITLLGARPGGSYFSWWQSGRHLDLGAQRWLRGLAVKPLPGRTLLLNVSERRPLLSVESAGARYWLCDDGTLVPMAAKGRDKGAPFNAIQQLPHVQLVGRGLDDAATVVDALLLAAAACNEVLPGQVKRITVNAAGEFSLFDSTGLEIRLGQPQELTAKIAALPKALRAANADRASLNYLDASEPRVGDRLVIYENRKTSAKPASR
jgi:hypothetical protein